MLHDWMQSSVLKIAFSHEIDCHCLVVTSVSTYIINRDRWFFKTQNIVGKTLTKDLKLQAKPQMSVLHCLYIFWFSQVLFPFLSCVNVIYMRLQKDNLRPAIYQRLQQDSPQHYLSIIHFILGYLVSFHFSVLKFPRYVFIFIYTRVTLKLIPPMLAHNIGGGCWK